MAGEQKEADKVLKEVQQQPLFHEWLAARIIQRNIRTYIKWKTLIRKLGGVVRDPDRTMNPVCRNQPVQTCVVKPPPRGSELSDHCLCGQDRDTISKRYTKVAKKKKTVQKIVTTAT